MMGVCALSSVDQLSLSVLVFKRNMRNLISHVPVYMILTVYRLMSICVDFKEY